MIIKFKTREELINDDNFQHLDAEHISLFYYEIPVYLLGKQWEAKSTGQDDEYEITEEDWQFYLSDIEDYIEIIERDRSIIIGDHTLTKVNNGFRVGCEFIEDDEMKNIVNFVLDEMGYHEIK